MKTIPLIIPPSSPLHRMMPSKRPTLLVTVLVVLAAHVIFLASLLIQGCQRENARFTSRDQSVALAGPFLGAQSPAGDPSASPASRAPAVLSAPQAPSATSGMGQSAPGIGAADVSNPAQEALVYIVKSGDTLSKIARAHHTTIQAVQTASGLKSDRLALGQKLCIPQ